MYVKSGADRNKTLYIEDFDDAILRYEGEPRYAENESVFVPVRPGAEIPFGLNVLKGECPADVVAKIFENGFVETVQLNSKILEHVVEQILDTFPMHWLERISSLYVDEIPYGYTDLTDLFPRIQFVLVYDPLIEDTFYLFDYGNKTIVTTITDLYDCDDIIADIEEIRKVFPLKPETMIFPWNMGEHVFEWDRNSLSRLIRKYGPNCSTLIFEAFEDYPIHDDRNYYVINACGKLQRGGESIVIKTRYNKDNVSIARMKELVQDYNQNPPTAQDYSHANLFANRVPTSFISEDRLISGEAVNLFMGKNDKVEVILQVEYQDYRVD